MKISAPPISTASVIEAAASTLADIVKGSGQAKGKDKDKKDKPEPIEAAPPPPAASPPPSPPPLSGGLNMTAVWESQADRRAEEKAEAEEIKAKSRVVTAPTVATDGSVEALSQMQSAVKNAEANRVAAEKAAEAKRAEAEQAQPRFPSPTQDRADPSYAEPENVRQDAKPSLSFQAYQSAYNPVGESGSILDARL